MDDMRLTDVLTRLGNLETAVGLNSERVAALTSRLDREVLRRVELSESHHQEQDHRIDSLEAFRDETNGALTLLRFLVGTSVLTAVLAAISIIISIANGTKL